jgi:hypothetical protein
MLLPVLTRRGDIVPLARKERSEEKDQQTSFHLALF